MPKSERVQKPDHGSARPATAASAPAVSGASPRPTAARLLALQRTAGNRAVQRLVNASRPPVQRLGEEDEAYGVYKPHDLPAAEPAAAAEAGPAAASAYGVYKPHDLPEAPAAAPENGAAAAAAAGYGAYRAHELPAAAGGGGGGGAAVDGSAAAAAAVTGPGGLAPLSLPAKYRGEDREVGWRATFGMNESTPPERRARAEAASHGTSLVTKYNTPEETAANTLKPSATADGGKALTTAAGDVASTKPVEYAMSPAGQVVANLGGKQFERDAAQRRNIHHSTMFAGGDVAHAGHIGVAGGQVNYLDDDSGHYRPDEAHTYAAFNELADQGVLNKDSAAGRVKLVDKSKEKGMGQGAAASVHFSGYQQAQGNEQAIRSRGAVMDELLRTRARYEGPPAAADAGGGGGGAMVYEPDAADAAAAPAAPAAAIDPSYAPVAGLPAAGGAAAGAASSPGSYSASGYTPMGGDAMSSPAAPAAAAAPLSPGYLGYSPYTPMAAEAAAAPSPYSAMAAEAAPASPYSAMPAEAAPASPYSAMPAEAAATPYGLFPMDRDE